MYIALGWVGIEFTSANSLAAGDGLFAVDGAGAVFKDVDETLVFPCGSLWVVRHFAYLTVAYFAGLALSEKETIIISALYIIALLTTFCVVMANVSAMGSFQQELIDSPVYQKIIFFMNANIYLALSHIEW